MPALPESLAGTEFGWLAVDDSGRVALFMTAGEGEVPSSVIPPSISEENVEAQLLEMPEQSDCRLHRGYKRPDDFVAIARRGVYAYDWTDVHRTHAGCTGTYELVAEPSNPVTVEHLPPALQRIGLATHLRGVTFGAPVGAVAFV